MGDYQMNMSEEKHPPSMLPEGGRLVRITEMFFNKSKSSGNDMFTTTIEDIKTRKSMQVYLVAVPKKRWKLKSLLAACELPASEDGTYDFRILDVIGKTVIAIVEHSQEPWIKTDGTTVMQTKCNVSEFVKVELSPSGQPMAWED